MPGSCESYVRSPIAPSAVCETPCVRKEWRAEQLHVESFVSGLLEELAARGGFRGFARIDVPTRQLEGMRFDCGSPLTDHDQLVARCRGEHAHVVGQNEAVVGSLVSHERSGQ